MKLSRIILQAIFIVAFVSIILTFFVSILFQYESFQDDKVYLQKEYIELKKEEIKREVLKVHKYIEYSRSLIEEKTKQELKNRVTQAHTIAYSLYEENKDKIPKDELQYLIVTALKNISYEDKRAYFFINSNSGQAILFNKQSKLNKNQNVWNLQDSKGEYIIQRQSHVAKNNDEGYLTNYFIKPDLTDNVQYPKLSFVKNFSPYDWHIGMGAYMDDMEHQVKEDILSWIASLRFGVDGYIFVNSTQRKALVFDGKKLEKPKYYSNDTLFEKQLNAINNKEGDYFFYKFKKLRSNKAFPKLAFVKEYKNWGWIIGSGVYIDEIENEITRKENILLNSMFDKMNVIFLFIFVLAISIYFISKRISTYINTNIFHLIKSFNDASRSNKEMNTKKLTYKEFETLARSLNKTLKARTRAEERLKRYIEIINENVITSSTNVSGIITEVSDAFCDISGYSQAELIGKSHSIVRHEDMPTEFYEEMWKSLRAGMPWEGEIKNKKKTGESYWVDTVIKPKYEKGKLVGYTAIRQDITDKKRVEYLSITDELTQLYNRRFFNETIENELNRAKRENQFISFMMMDVDYFKHYNDTYGHQAGDHVLKEVAKVLIEHTKRASDFAFRLGGEEFGIICTLRDKNESQALAQLIREDIERLKIKHETSEVSDYLTISIGLVSNKAMEIKSSDSFYKKADEALYKAKNSGRNRVYLEDN